MKKNNLIILGSSLVFILLIVCLVMPKKDPEKLTTNPKNDEALVKIEKFFKRWYKYQLFCRLCQWGS